MEQKINVLKTEGDSLSTEMSVHSPTISLGLSQILEKWENLLDLIKMQKKRLSSAQNYFQMTEKSQKFLREANQNLLTWSRTASGLTSNSEAANLKAEIERYIKTHQSVQTEMLMKISSMGGEIFGSQLNDDVKSVKSVTETFDALHNLLLQIETFLTHRKSLDDEKRLQAESEANIRAAKAEAEAARRAAREAEEARRAAEEATKKALIEFKTNEPSSVAPLFTNYLQDVVLREGEKCQLKARVSGIPKPNITWFKDGVPVQNSDYKVSTVLVPATVL